MLNIQIWHWGQHTHTHTWTIWQLTRPMDPIRTADWHTTGSGDPFYNLSPFGGAVGRRRRRPFIHSYWFVTRSIPFDLLDQVLMVNDRIHLDSGSKNLVYKGTVANTIAMRSVCVSSFQQHTHKKRKENTGQKDWQFIDYRGPHSGTRSERQFEWVCECVSRMYMSLVSHWLKPLSIVGSVDRAAIGHDDGDRHA